MILRSTFRNHLAVSGFTWVTTAVFLALWAYFHFDRDFLLIAGSFHLFFTLPAFYLHITYALRNAGEEIEISQTEIVLRKKGGEFRYDSESLASIVIYKSASLDKGGIPLSAMEYYRYARIVCKSGEEIIITCLMTLDLENALRPLSNVPRRRKKVIAFLFWE